MKSYLIKDTTKLERIELIKQWQEPDDCVGGSGMDLFDMYNDYIEGKREISEINMSYRADYVVGEIETEEEEMKPQSSAADEIMKLKGLMDQGILTAQEFEAGKKKILGM